MGRTQKILDYGREEESDCTETVWRGADASTVSHHHPEGRGLQEVGGPDRGSSGRAGYNRTHGDMQ